MRRPPRAAPVVDASAAGARRSVASRAPRDSRLGARHSPNPESATATLARDSPERAARCQGVRWHGWLAAVGSAPARERRGGAAGSPRSRLEVNEGMWQ
eukprot:scaffold1505_cov390-Prasinococcus_capsulatus_cf.AAC.14